MKKLGLMAAAVIATLGSAHALAQQAEGPWMVRVRALYLDPAEKSDAIPAAGVPKDVISPDSKLFPEIDFSYFISKNLAAELILTYPQKHNVELAGTAVGTLKHLPPTLTLQYHFAPDADFRPYVGAGVNYTRLTSVDLKPLNAVTSALAGSPNTNSLKRDSFGAALQIGADLKVAQNSFINFDIKKVYIDTELSNSALGKLSKVKVDPTLISIGYGWRF